MGSNYGSDATTSTPETEEFPPLLDGAQGDSGHHPRPAGYHSGVDSDPRPSTTWPGACCGELSQSLVQGDQGAAVGTCARAATGSIIALSETPIPYVRKQSSGTSSSTVAARRSFGRSDRSFFDTVLRSSEPAGCAITRAWKLIVAGGIGSTSDRGPPRRTGIVTATSWPSAIWRAFQPSGATATYRWCRSSAYTTPLDRGSPAGVTWLTIANEALPTSAQTCWLVNRGFVALSTLAGEATVASSLVLTAGSMSDAVAISGKPSTSAIASTRGS